MSTETFSNPRLLKFLRLASFASDVALLPVIIVVAGISRISRRLQNHDPRIVWGSSPLVNNIYWASAMRAVGFHSVTFMFNHYSINKRSDFDRVLVGEYRWCPLPFRPYLAFMSVLARYDVIVTSVSGFMVVTPILRRIQAGVLKLAGVKLVVIPFGGDAYVYSRVRSSGLLQGLLFSYPRAAREQRRIARELDYWCERADVLIPGVMGIDGIGRWDVPISSALSLDLEKWKPSVRYSRSNGADGVVRICHAPNHRGFKGTEFIVDAVKRLNSEGLRVELQLLEGLPNEEIRRALREDFDLLVEQVVFTGHGMNGLEGMASGLPVICNLEDEQYLLPARRWSFFSECPLVSAEPENLVDVLRELVTRPDLRKTLGGMGRKYVEKYHGLDSSQYLFGAVLDYLYGRRATLSDLYHPLTSAYVNRLPRIEPPLDRNRLRMTSGANTEG